jgi:hypothetical protein
VWKGEEADEGGLLASVLEHVSEKLGSMRHVSTEGYLCRVLTLWQSEGRWKLRREIVMFAKHTRVCRQDE